MVHLSTTSMRHHNRFSNNRVTDRRTYGAAHIPTALQTHKHAKFHINKLQQFGLITGCWERPLFDSQSLCSFGHASVQIASAVWATNWILTDNQTEWIVSGHRGYCVRHKCTSCQIYKCVGQRVGWGFWRWKRHQTVHSTWKLVRRITEIYSTVMFQNNFFCTSYFPSFVNSFLQGITFLRANTILLMALINIKIY